MIKKRLFIIYLLFKETKEFVEALINSFWRVKEMMDTLKDEFINEVLEAEKEAKEGNLLIWEELQKEWEKFHE